MYLTLPLKGFSVEMGTGARGQKSRRMAITGPRKKFDDVFSRLNTIYERDGQSDGRTNRHWPTTNNALTHISNADEQMQALIMPLYPYSTLLIITTII